MGSSASKEAQEDERGARQSEEVDDDEPDEWDKRIYSTGCADEQTRMNDCWYEKRDWRQCSQEMLAFKECWKRKGNDERTETKDA